MKILRGIELPLALEKARAYVERVTLAKSSVALKRWQKKWFILGAYLMCRYHRQLTQSS